MPAGAPNDEAAGRPASKPPPGRTAPPHDRSDRGPRHGDGPKGAPPAVDGTSPRKKKKKKRKVRTKDCVGCYTPHVTIHRVKITHRKQWSFICDVCWADRCVDNPHYEYGGLWMSGRVMPPESELYAEWLAKRKKNKKKAKPTEPPYRAADTTDPLSAPPAAAPHAASPAAEAAPHDG